MPRPRAFTAVPKQDTVVDGLDTMLDRFLTKHTVSEKDSDKNPFGWVDILTFAESEYYLGVKLYPWQRLILKAMYMGTRGNGNLAILESEERCCANCVWQGEDIREPYRCIRCRRFDPDRRGEILRLLAEEYYLDVTDLRDADLVDGFMNEVMMIEQDLPDTSDATFGGSVKEQFKRKIGKSFTELVLVLGRRSGKSLMVSIVALYEAYKLIQMGHPQKYYRNLSEGDTITILNVAPSEASAKEAVFSKITDMITRSAYFKSKISPGSLLQREVRFLTPRDQELNLQLAEDHLPPISGTIYLLSGHSNSDSLVGKTALVVIVDEMASLNNREGSKMSDQELYIRLKNCTLTFRDQAKIMCISSPMTKEGQFFSLYESSFKSDSVLMVQLPSWIVNPTVTEEWLKQEQKNYVEQGVPHMFTMEIEARFLGGASSPLVPAEKVDDARERGRLLERVNHGDPRKQYFAHADPALNSDNYAFAIVHAEENPYMRDERGLPLPVIIVDHINMWSPVRHEDGTITPVNIAEVDQYILEMHQKFRFLNLSYDSWQSAASIQKLQALGVPVQETPFTNHYMEVIYGELLSLFLQDRIVLYAHGPFSDEAADQLKFLQKRYTSAGHRIEAVSGHHDDIPACIAGAAHVATSGAHSVASLPRIRTRRFPALNGR